MFVNSLLMPSFSGFSANKGHPVCAKQKKKLFSAFLNLCQGLHKSKPSNKVDQ